MKRKISDQFFSHCFPYIDGGYVDSFYNHKTIEDLAMNLSIKVHCGTYHLCSIFFFLSFCLPFSDLILYHFIGCPFFVDILNYVYSIHAEIFYHFRHFHILLKYPQNRNQLHIELCAVRVQVKHTRKHTIL